jgi:hypothetical protein
MGSIVIMAMKTGRLEGENHKMAIKINEITGIDRAMTMMG